MMVAEDVLLQCSYVGDVDWKVEKQRFTVGQCILLHHVVPYIVFLGKTILSMHTH
jgi:hypothetical protein